MPSKNIVWAVVLLSAAGVGIARAGVGTSGADFVQITADPQSAAMGDSIVYAPPSAAVMASNPAAMTSLYQAKLSLTNMTLADGISYRFAGMVFPGRSATFGLAVSYVSYGDMQRYDAAGIAEGSFSPKDMMWVISGAVPLRRDYPITEDFGSIGASVKMIQTNLADYTAQTLTGDIGALFRLPWQEQFTGGISLKNVGGSIRYNTRSDPLPLTGSFGVKFEKHPWSELVVTADVSRVITEELTSVSAGIRFSPVYPVTIRAGWKQVADHMLSGLRAGVGLDFNYFSLNYAVIPSKEFSLVHQLGLDIAFGRIVRPDIAYNYYLTYHFQVAKEKFKRKDYLAARQELEEILSLYPDHQESKEYLAMIGQALDEIEKQRMVGISRWLARAQIAFSRNDLMKARRYYNYVLGVDPENAEALEGLARIDETARQLRLNQGLSSRKAELAKLWDESIVYYRSGSYVEAKEGFKKYLAANPSNREAQNYVNEIDKQLQVITTMQTNELFSKGVALYEQGNYREAIKYFNAVSMAVPSRTDAQQYADRCQKYLKDEDQKIYIEQQERTKEMGKEKIKEQIDAAYAHAVRLYHQAAYADAMQSFAGVREMALQYPGFEGTAVNAKNYINIIKGHYAEKEFKSGSALAQDGKLEAAAEAYRRALVYDRNHSGAKDGLARVSDALAQQFYEQGMNAYTTGDMANAKEFFKKSLLYKPDKPESLRALERMK